MRLPSQFATRTALRFNITPLIDVVFLLIIFFLVASHFVRSEQAEAVNLPTAVNPQADDESAAERLTITVLRDGQLSVSGIRVTRQHVLDRLQELQMQNAHANEPPEVRIRCDRDAEYVHVRHLLEHIAANGITRIRFAVLHATPDAATGG